jgi:hypothetical protein
MTDEKSRETEDEPPEVEAAPSESFAAHGGSEDTQEPGKSDVEGHMLALGPEKFLGPEKAKGPERAL